MSKRVAIVGAGVAGCSAAIRLAERGFAVDLYEAVAEPQPIGAGLLLQPTGQAALASMGLLDEALAAGARVGRLYGDTPSGRAVLRMNYRDFAPEAFGLGVQRGALMGLLWRRVQATSGIHWHCGVTVDRFEQSPEGVRLYGHGQALSDEMHAALILANGSFSHLREQMRVRQSAKIFPWGAVWTVLPAPADFPQIELRQRFRAARQMIGLMPVGRNHGETADARAGINLFWSLPIAQVETWQQAGQAELAALKHQMCELLPMVAPLLDALQEPAQLRQARYADVSMSQWHDHRVLAIGDCGHGMSPQLGQGANMALIDAQVLAEEADGDWPAVFARYNQRRRSHLRFYTQASRGLTPLFQSHGRIGPWFRDVFFGWGGQLPVVYPQSVGTLTGYKTGWLYGRLKI